MKLTKAQQKMTLIVLVALIVLLNGYNFLTGKKPKTAPLTYTRGAVARSSVRDAVTTRAGKSDPLDVFLAQRQEKYPGVVRDIFRMENPSPKLKLKLPPPPVITAPTPTVLEKTPEQIAEELARAELSKFRFLGYLTEKDNTLFLSKDGELFMVKSGGVIFKNYKIKEAGKDYVVLMDMITLAEARVELSGSEQAPTTLPQQRVQQPQAVPQRPQIVPPPFPQQPQMAPQRFQRPPQESQESQEPQEPQQVPQMPQMPWRR